MDVVSAIIVRVYSKEVGTAGIVHENSSFRTAAGERRPRRYTQRCLHSLMIHQVTSPPFCVTCSVVEVHFLSFSMIHFFPPHVFFCAFVVFFELRVILSISRLSFHSTYHPAPPTSFQLKETLIFLFQVYCAGLIWAFFVLCFFSIPPFLLPLRTPLKYFPVLCPLKRILGVTVLLTIPVIGTPSVPPKPKRAILQT